jgi:hypothetical protein
MALSLQRRGKKNGLVGRCSLCSGRILGGSGDVVPDSEASGELAAMTNGAKLFTLDREMLTDRPKARQEALGAPR